MSSSPTTGTRSAPRAKPSRKPVVTYRCGECGWTAAKWVGRCGECQAWGSVEEVGSAATARTTRPAVISSPARPIAEIDIEAATAVGSGVAELDRVLGGGLVPGAVVLLAGEPGVGKSTLLLDVASQSAQQGRKILYISGEESAAQIRLRAERIGALRPRLFLAAETDLATVLGHIENTEPDLLIVDSVQTIASGEVEGSAGGVTQVREVTSSLIRAAKDRNMSTIVVGHVTKDGSIAGPRMLEHLVDVVCQFEGDRHSRLRMVRAIKNRYGPTDEVGCFDLTEQGIVGLPDPSGLFLSQSGEPVSGTCVSVTLEGRRPLVAEVQSLVADSAGGSPRRATSGLDSNRVAMVLAVLGKRLEIPLGSKDVYVATVGGSKVTEPAIDLAAAISLASAYLDRPTHHRLVAFGEIGLSGELRSVPGVSRRLSEAARIGFTHALVPSHALDQLVIPQGMKVREVNSVQQAIDTVLR
ncbi:DNA repair protein RadA [Saxibacter everestensis]|uniref:DNA repair protein RadA n=1 Tax=Saxibacter everestensis TaxID=2909229 RepID=A0ABY8QS49_9MICO|nr:DNA repair protein RadA [Brevibacteriaceae bacterium ZFBP1038]